jgi:hypothetical protein
MKVTIDIDLSPAEFREAIGLPDVKSVQDRWMVALEKSVAEEIEKLSPEALAKQWAGALIPNPDLVSSLLKMMPGSGSGSGSKS